MITVERVDFVSVPTRDLDRARCFDGETLGLPQCPTAPDEFEASNVTLGLWDPGADGEPFEPNTAGVALRVADVAESRRLLEAAGVQFKGDTVDTGVCHMAFFFDPDGNVLILHRRYV
jgi:catechol 2,3-dioxygenase-like lactoylglutathione lyase family enzyme